MDLRNNYTAKNGYIVTRLFVQDEVLSNGIKIQDTRGKKDIICATCLLAEEKFKIPWNALVWFPVYAATPIKLNGEQLLIIPFEDIMLIEKTED